MTSATYTFPGDRTNRLTQAKAMRAACDYKFSERQSCVQRKKAEKLLEIIKDYCYIATERDLDTGHFEDELACDEPVKLMEHLQALLDD